MALFSDKNNIVISVADFYCLAWIDLCYSNALSTLFCEVKLEKIFDIKCVLKKLNYFYE